MGVRGKNGGGGFSGREGHPEEMVVEDFRTRWASGGNDGGGFPDVTGVRGGNGGGRNSGYNGHPKENGGEYETCGGFTHDEDKQE